MNFKPSWLKVILSIIVGIINGVLLTGMFYEPSGLIDILGPIIIMVLSVFSAVIIYIIWSLLQRKILESSETER